MKKVLTPAERLIVAADFKPTNGQGRDWVRAQVLTLADELHGTGVYIKVNSALRACGYDLIGEIQSRGLKVFADLKLYDIGETLATDGIFLKEAKPELLTTVCTVGSIGMQALKAQLPNTEVLGVTVLTSLTLSDTIEMFNSTISASVMNFARIGESAGLDGLICAPTDIHFIQEVLKRAMTLNTPAIRPTWSIVPGDDQNPERIMTPTKAIQANVDRIIVGRPIINAANRYEAVMRTIDEIAAATR